MNNILKYDLILVKSIKYLEESRWIFKRLEVAKGWRQIALGHEELFYNTSYFIFAIDKLRDAPIVDKYIFINSYYTLLAFGVIPPYPHRISLQELKISFQADINEILGPNLVTANAHQPMP